MRCKSIFIFVFAVFLIGLASASFITSASFNFSENGSSLTTQYKEGAYAKANINISFQNESLNSTFVDSRGHSIQLWDLLSRTAGYAYRFNDSANKSIDSNFSVLKFDKANFSMPGTTGTFSYQLNFSGVQLFNKTVEIKPTGEAVKAQIDEKYAQLNASKVIIKKYDLNVQKLLNKFLNMTFLESDLKKVETQYGNADTEEEFDGVLENLSYIIIPEEITETTVANSIDFYPSRDIIDLDILKSIGGGDYGENWEGYVDSVSFWNVDNLKTKITFREILINYGFDDETTLKIFQFVFDKRNVKDEAYFIIADMIDLNFAGNYSEREESGYYYINLKDISDKIIFSTTEEIDFLSVPAFISPSINDLNPVNVGDFTAGGNEGKLSKWMLFGLIIFLLLLIAIIAYVVLQTWYRRKYENYLFKNRNSLYNIMTYIQNAKKRGIEREEIIKNLKKANWTGEQINYALRKYEGEKIVGIIEKPFKKVIEEIEKDSPNK